MLTDRDTKPGLGTREFISDDLKKLTESRDDEFPDGDDEEDLPPLIQVRVLVSKYSNLLLYIFSCLVSLHALRFFLSKV